MLRKLVIVYMATWLLLYWYAGGWPRLLCIAHLVAFHYAARIDGLYPSWLRRWL